jgi:hypothetical protein
MDRIIVIDADGGKPRPSLDMVPVKLTSQSDILKLLRERKIPLDQVAVADKGSGALYLAEDTTLSSVHDPYTGNQVKIDPDFQTYIGSVELAGDGLCLHSVFVDESGSVCTETGAVCDLRPVALKSWTGAMLELTFGNGVESGQ